MDAMAATVASAMCITSSYVVGLGAQVGPQGRESAMDIPTWLRAVRKERGWSTYKMAEIAGVSEASVVLWEQEKRRPSAPSCWKLAEATGTPVEDVMRMAFGGGGDDEDASDTTMHERRALTGILDVIERIAHEHGSVNAGARAMGMPQATLHNIRKGAEPTLPTLELIAAYKQMPLWKLLREAEEQFEGKMRHRGE